VNLQPLAVLVVAPIAIGIASQLLFGHPRKAAGAAMLGAAALVVGSVIVGDPGGAWTWLASLLVLPLPVALALTAVLLVHGRSGVRNKHHR
jgi:hypothetical protein